VLCSEDIIAHIQGQQDCVRLSLYTASHLMYGVVVVYQKQQHYLIGLLHTVHDSCLLDFPTWHTWPVCVCVQSFHSRLL